MQPRLSITYSDSPSARSQLSGNETTTLSLAEQRSQVLLELLLPVGHAEARGLELGEVERRVDGARGHGAGGARVVLHDAEVGDAEGNHLGPLPVLLEPAAGGRRGRRAPPP